MHVMLVRLETCFNVLWTWLVDKWGEECRSNLVGRRLESSVEDAYMVAINWET